MSSSPFSSRSASLFPSCSYVLHDHYYYYYLFRSHIYVLTYGICFSLSDLLHSEWQTLGYDPAIPLLGIYPEKTIIQKESCTTMFIAALFTIARTRNPSVLCPCLANLIQISHRGKDVSLFLAGRGRAWWEAEPLLAHTHPRSCCSCPVAWVSPGRAQPSS